MRIKFTDTGEEYQISGIPTSGNSAAGGRYISKQGVLCKGVEDITEYRTEVVDGVKTKVEVVPGEVEEPRPDSSWLVVDIKLWLDAQGVEYTSSMLKADLLALV
jgi:hypothetical protein